MDPHFVERRKGKKGKDREMGKSSLVTCKQFYLSL